MKRLITASMIALITVGGISGCATQNFYQPSQQMPAIQNTGTVLSLQHYQDQNRDPSVLGGVVGAVGGVALGSVMGGGTGKVATMMAGGLLGGVAGSQLAASNTPVDMVNMAIALDNGTTISVNYQDKGFYVGQKVTVQQQGNNYMVYPIR